LQLRSSEPGTSCMTVRTTTHSPPRTRQSRSGTPNCMQSRTCRRCTSPCRSSGQGTSRRIRRSALRLSTCPHTIDRIGLSPKDTAPRSRSRCTLASTRTSCRRSGSGQDPSSASSRSSDRHRHSPRGRSRRSAPRSGPPCTSVRRTRSSTASSLRLHIRTPGHPPGRTRRRRPCGPLRRRQRSRRIPLRGAAPRYPPCCSRRRRPPRLPGRADRSPLPGVTRSPSATCCSRAPRESPPTLFPASTSLG